MYSEKVMDHFQHPRNVGEIENASGVGTVGNAKCGDIMRIYLDIDDKTLAAQHSYQQHGTEMVMGKASRKVTNKAVWLTSSWVQGHPCGSLGLCRETAKWQPEIGEDKKAPPNHILIERGIWV